jgi:hypothetical protein
VRAFLYEETQNFEVFLYGGWLMSIIFEEFQHPAIQTKYCKTLADFSSNKSWPLASH